MFANKIVPKPFMPAFLFIGCLLLLNAHAKQIGQIVPCSLKACVEDPGKYFELDASYYVMRDCADGMFYNPLSCRCSTYYSGFFKNVGYSHYFDLLRRIRYIRNVYND